MKKNLSIWKSLALAATAGWFLSPGGAAAVNQTAVQGEEVCVPPAIEQELQKCPTDIEMKRFGKGPRGAKVGVSSRETDADKKGKKKPAGPSLGRDYTKKIIEGSFHKVREKKKIDLVKKEIELLKRLKQTTDNKDPEKAEVIKRLADAYKELYDQLNFMAREMDEKIFQADKKGQKKEKSRMLAQQKKLEAMAREYREKSIKEYVDIRNSFPDYPNYDEILFAIAYEIDQLATEQDDKGKKAAYRKRAREFYQELIRNYPRSRFIPHSWMAFGEYYFHEARDVDRAMRSYEKVVEWGEENNPNYVIAMYYQAWCLFNMQEYQKTLNQFNEVIQYAEKNPENREAQSVAKRARKEMVEPFSKIGNPSQAWKFFNRIGGDQAHEMLEKLANVYYDEGQWADAIIVLHKLESLELENYRKNNGDDLCNYQFMVTNAVINSRPKKEQLDELTRQLALYKKFSEESGHSKAKVEECAAKTATIAWDQATHWHVEAVGSESSPGTKDRETMEVTIGLYNEMLKSFPNLDSLEIDGFDENTKPTNYRVAYYKAELLWNMEDWDKCGPAFDAVVEMNPTGNYTSDAAYAAVLCYNKVYSQERADTDRERKHALKAGGDVECDKKCLRCKSKCKGPGKAECEKSCEPKSEALVPRQLTELEQGILNSYERYVCFIKDGEDLVNIKYRRARIYYEANMFPEAAVLFKDLAVNHSNDEVAVYAANLYLDSLNAMGSLIEQPRPSCYDDLAAAVDIFIDSSKKPGVDLMKDEEFATQVKSLKVGVLRKKAESLKDRKRFKESANVYLTIYREYQGVYDEAGMCEVLFNTALMMEAANLMMPAIRVREKMVELYPDCEHSKKAAYYIGANYHALLFFPNAAENYQKFSKKYPGEEEAPDALANAVMFYIGLGEHEQAFKAVSLYEQNYGKRHPDKTATVVFSAGMIHVNEAVENNNKDAWDDVRKYYTLYTKRYSKVKHYHEQAQAYVYVGDSFWNSRKPDYKNAEKSYNKAIAIFEKQGLDSVTNPKDKAILLQAAAKALYQVAELKFFEFQKVKFPEFKPEREVPKKIMAWWKKQKGPEEFARYEEMVRYRRVLARWGEMTRVEVRKEEKKEKANIQFDYYMEYKVKPWIEEKSKVLQEASTLFAKVVDLPVTVPEWEMAAAARAGDMQLEFMQSLYDAPIPPAIKDDQELVDIYRGAMDEKAQPYRDSAINLYDHCLQVSTKLRWFNQNSLRCENQLYDLDPRKYPKSEEIRVQPDNDLTLYAVPDAVLELETAAQRRERELKTSAENVTGSESDE